MHIIAHFSSACVCTAVLLPWRRRLSVVCPLTLVSNKSLYGSKSILRQATYTSVSRLFFFKSLDLQIFTILFFSFFNMGPYGGEITKCCPSLFQLISIKLLQICLPCGSTGYYFMGQISNILWHFRILIC